MAAVPSLLWFCGIAIARGGGARGAGSKPLLSTGEQRRQTKAVDRQTGRNAEGERCRP